MSQAHQAPVFEIAASFEHTALIVTGIDGVFRVLLHLPAIV